MMVSNRILVIVALVSILSVATPLMLSQSFQTESTSRTTGCLVTSLSDIDEEYDFPIRQPDLKLIADNAALQGIDDFKEVVKLYYADFSICSFDRSVEQMKQDGLVILTIYKHSKHFKDSAAYQESQSAYFDSFPYDQRNVQRISVNEYKGIGWEPFDGESVVRLNGEVIDSTPSHAAGAVRFYHEDDKTVYYLSADRPLSEIREIAESIR